jgi:hypothetical protein
MPFFLFGMVCTTTEDCTMSIKLSPVLRQMNEYTVYFWCPACLMIHPVYLDLPKNPRPYKNDRWMWNGDAASPTFSPSLVVQGPRGLCHSYVRNGQMEFLGDCGHPLKGQTVLIPDFPEDEDLF